MEAVYDLRQSPVTYDICHWLANVERHRQLLGESAVDVVFVEGDRQRTERDLSFSPERKAWRLHNLLVPSCRLLPSVRSYKIVTDGTQTLPYTTTQYNGVYFHATGAASSLMAAWTRTNKPIVTLTMRQSDFQTKRNSNLDEWAKCAEWLTKQGYAVIVVPDTEATLSGEKPIDWPETRLCIPAAMSPDLRLALYERASMNLFTSGGPYALALYSGSPFMMCKTIVPSIGTCTEDYQRGIGLTPETILNPYQRILWRDDTFESIKEPLEEMLQSVSTRERPLAKMYTFAVLPKERVEQIKGNMTRGVPMVEQVPRHDRTMAIVGYGPSLKDTWRTLTTTSDDIFTTSGAHDFLMDRGIIPMGHVATDPRKEQVDFIQHRNKMTTYYPASCCHPTVFEWLTDYRIRMWHAWDGDDTEQAVLERDPNAFFILGGSNVGLRSIALGSALGYRKFTLYGMDCSMKEGQRHAGAHNGKKQKLVRVRPTGSEQWFDTTPQMVSGANEFLAMAAKLITEGYEFTLVGDGLLPEMVKVATQPKEVLT